MKLDSWHWLNRAEESKLLAETMSDPEAQRTMLAIGRPALHRIRAVGQWSHEEFALLLQMKPQRSFLVAARVAGLLALARKNRQITPAATASTKDMPRPRPKRVHLRGNVSIAEVPAPLTAKAARRIDCGALAEPGWTGTGALPPQTLRGF